MRRLALVVPLLVCAGLAAGCSGKDPEQASGPGSDEPSAASTGPEVIVENGVELTPAGTELAVGETANVAYEPRQGLVGVLEITVDRLEKTSFKKSFVGWDLDAQTKKSSPYFVRATITNRGTTQLGGRPVPLYIVDANNNLIEANSFASEFKPCTPGAFPKKFGPGKSVKVCTVYLAPSHGDLVAVSFRPTQEVEGITWTGELKSPKPPKKDGKKGDKNGKNDKDDEKGNGDGGGQG